MYKDKMDIDLRVIWQKMSKEKFENKNFEKQEIMNAIKAKSKFTIDKLKKGLKIKVIFCSIFALIFLLITPFQKDDPIAFWYYMILCILYIAGSLFLYNRYKKMDHHLVGSTSLLENLKLNKTAIKSALFVERIWGLLAIILVLAFVFYKQANKSSSVKEVVVKISIFLVIVIIMWIIAEIANKRKFGNKIKEIEENIIRLEMLN